MAAAGSGGVSEPSIGIIGGSGLYEMDGLADVRWRRVRTPFGEPSDAYCCGRLVGLTGSYVEVRFDGPDELIGTLARVRVTAATPAGTVGERA